MLCEALDPRLLLSTVPAGFSDARVTSGIAQGTSMAMAPDGRLFVAEQGGKLRVIKNNALLSTPFVKVTTVTDASEGLIGVAIDPSFSSNHYIYLAYTKSSPRRTVVSRFTASGDKAVTGSEKVLFTSDTLDNHEHNGGALAFGTDGKLYIAFGDDLTITNAQSKDTTQGKILRINKDGTIPTDNPFYKTSSGGDRAIWAYGFRNPFTLSFQPTTGRLFSGDVGSDFWEEINDIKKGANYGWSNTEGPTKAPGETSALFAYQHKIFGECVIGGSFYNPTTATFPASYVGKFFFADYVRGWIKTLDVSGSTPKTADFVTGLNRCVSIITASNGSVYYLLRGGANGSGEVHRITYSTTAPPSIAEQPQNQTIPFDQSVTFSISAAGATPLKYQWRRNGSNINGATNSSFTINTVDDDDDGDLFDCIVTNNKGSKTSDKAKLTVIHDEPPVPKITLPDTDKKYHAGEIIDYSGEAHDEEDGDLDDSAFSWTILFHHDTHTHPFIGPVDGVDSASFEVPQVEETSDNVWYEIILTVTDHDGISTTISQDIKPEKVLFTVEPSVPGLSVGVDSVAYTDPPSIKGVIGIRRQLSAPLVQVLDGAVYQFTDWSDGGDATHFIFTPDEDTTYTANYTQIGTVPVGTGLSASYYDNDNFTGTKKTRSDPQVNFIWSKDAPISGIGVDSFSVRWSGGIVAPTSEKYTFYTNSDDGVKLWIDNKLIIDHFSSTSLKEYSGSITLEAGKTYAIKMEYKDVSGFAQAQLSWSTPQIARQVVPTWALFPTAPTPPPPPPPPPPEATTILSANADTYVHGRTQADTNYGAEADLRVKLASDTDYVRETYIRFDLTDVETITSAFLSLAGKRNNGDDISVGVYAASVTPEWDQSTLTWNNRFLSDPTPMTSFLVNSTSTKTYTADVTSYLQAEKAAGRNVVTLILKATAITTSYASFSSTEAGNGPQLLIS